MASTIDSLSFQTQALLLRSQRQSVIASNIANADTPGYQSRDMNFAQALQQATSSASSVAGRKPGGTATGDADLQYAVPDQDNLDRNTVDLDRERASFADNSVKYEAALRFISQDVKNMMDAIKGGN